MVAAVAQPVERRPGKAEAPGSNPGGGSKNQFANQSLHKPALIPFTEPIFTGSQLFGSANWNGFINVYRIYLYYNVKLYSILVPKS